LLQVGRALGNVVSTYMFIFALVFVPLADATVIGFVAPLMVTALSVPPLRENVGGRRWSAVVIVFLGALVILRPGLGVMHWSSFLLLGSAPIYAIDQIATRVLSVHDKPIATLFYTSAVGLTASAFLAPIG
jgi:drug/metabolite transporter (DMT)-like permease